MKKITILFLLFANLIAFSKYYLVKIQITSSDDFKLLENLNLDFESAMQNKNEFLIIVNDFEKEQLSKSNLKYELLIEDYETYLADQIAQKESKIPSKVLQGFELGSMGGFYTYEEIFQQVDKLTINNPFFVASDTIGYSWEKRPIIAYCFGSKDSIKPEVLFTALHHSREPATVTSLLFFLKTLFDKAKNEDEEAIYLLNNRRIWIIPILNPDGYLYNQIRYPKGGGLWRKNRRPISQSDTGVDLNRNYGPYEFWNANNNGSSTNPKNETYRGPAPFSEPELIALRNFCFRRNFQLALNLHTYGGMLIYPYSALQTETPDSSWYRSFGIYIQQLNSYYFGTDRQTVGYPTRGASDDWFYTPDSSKGKVIAFSPELSYQFDGFWPEASRIVQIATENFKMFWEFIWSAEENIKLVDYSYNFDTTRKVGYLHLTFQNLGLKPSRNNTPVKVSSINKSYQFLLEFQIESLSPSNKFTKTLLLPTPNENFNNGTEVAFLVVVNQNGIERRDTFYANLYDYYVINLKDSTFWDFSNSFWGFENVPDSNFFILCDSPHSNYRDSLDNYLTSLQQTRIGGNNFELVIQSEWSIEPFYDFAKIEVSTNYGKDWIPMRSKRSTIASGNQYGKQKLGDYGYSGYFPYLNTQIITLKEYLWKNILFRLSLLSDRGKNSYGWNIHQILLRVYPSIDFKNYVDAKQYYNIIHLYNNDNFLKSINLQDDLICYSLILYNILGEKALSIHLDDRNIQRINIPTIPTGIYLIQLVTNKGNRFDKVLIK